MTPRSVVLSALLISACLFRVAQVAGQDAAITTDPAPGKDFPAAIQTFQLPSHGVLLNAFVYVASGAGPHPTVILLHGFPGNERNLDLAQSIRRAGWDVLFFDYRGSWGTPGDFSFTHCIEDTQSALAYLRDPSTAAKLRSDPKTIVLVGHSMGGFAALETAALDPAVEAVVTISAADMGAGRLRNVPAGKFDAAVGSVAAGYASEGMAPLAGTSAEGLAREIIAHAGEWDFVNLAPKLATRPLLVVTSDDGLADSNDAFVAALRRAGNTKVTAIHMPTDHSYSDHRIAMQQAVLSALEHLDLK